MACPAILPCRCWPWQWPGRSFEPDLLGPAAARAQVSYTLLDGNVASTGAVAPARSCLSTWPRAARWRTRCRPSSRRTSASGRAVSTRWPWRCNTTHRPRWRTTRRRGNCPSAWRSTTPARSPNASAASRHADRAAGRQARPRGACYVGQPDFAEPARADREADRRDLSGRRLSARKYQTNQITSASSTARTGFVPLPSRLLQSQSLSRPMVPEAARRPRPPSVR